MKAAACLAAVMSAAVDVRRYIIYETESEPAAAQLRLNRKFQDGEIESKFPLKAAGGR